MVVFGYYYWCCYNYYYNLIVVLLELINVDYGLMGNRIEYYILF